MKQPPTVHVSVLLLGAAMLCLGLSCGGGCSKSSRAETKSDGNSPRMPAVRVLAAAPKQQTITRSITVPGIIQAYEQTAVYTKIAGYVLSWDVDLGFRVKKDQLMATLLVPELVEQHREKVAMLAQQQQGVAQAKEAVTIAQRQQEVATSEIAEANADVERYAASTARWKAEYVRLQELAKAKAVDIRVVQEAEEHYRAEQSAERASKVVVLTKQTEQLAAKAEVDKAKVNVVAAEAAVKVAEATAARYAALLAYTRVTAPYDGVVTARNVSVGDLVRPGAGEADAALGGGAGGKAVPLFVVARMDVLMFVVGVPELDAGLVRAGSPVTVHVQSIGVADVDTKVTRISWSVGTETRTLTAQIDLPNSKGQLMPGMYATGAIEAERKDALCVPASAIVAKGESSTCYFIVDGRAVQQPVEMGISNDDWAQITRKQPASGSDKGKWVPVSSSDQVIYGDLSEVVDGVKVEVTSGHGSQAQAAATGD